VAPTNEKVERLKEKLRLETPLIAVYDAAPDEAFEPTVTARGRACCFAYYKQWLQGKTLVIEKDKSNSFGDPQSGCPGAQRAFGLTDQYPPWMAHFLTDGEGAPMGEGLKATPQLAREYIERARPPALSGDTVLLGPLKLERWNAVRSVSFFVDPDRLAAVMTLSAFWSSDPDFVTAPFSSGCGLLWRDLDQQNRERAMIGCTDIAMRRYIPPEILCLTVRPGHFEKMVGFPEGAFLNREWWNALMEARAAQRREDPAS
jgi:hypothetical protein